MYLFQTVAALVLCTSCKGTPAPIDSFYPCKYEDFWWAVSMAESGGNPKSVYHESFPKDKWCPHHNKMGMDSLGLFQVSFPEDRDRYQCPFNNRDSAFSAVLNATCKDLIAEKLKANNPNKNWSQVLGLYWSTLRSYTDWKKWHEDNPNHHGFDDFRKFAAQRGCVIK
jgi:hypothetical protein